EFLERGAGDLVAYVGAGLHPSTLARRREARAGAVGIALVLAQVLVDAAAEAATQHRAGEDRGHVVRIGGGNGRTAQAHGGLHAAVALDQHARGFRLATRSWRFRGFGTGRLPVPERRFGQREGLG